jgi:hypothetical protein
MAAVPGILRQWNPGIVPGLSLWIDGQDSSTLTLNENQSNIAAISDKSGQNIQLVQGVTANQPVLRSNVNNFQTIGFRGANYVSTVTSNFASQFNNPTAISQFTVFNLRSNNTTQGFTSFTDTNFINSNSFSFGTIGNVFRLLAFNNLGPQLTVPTIFSNMFMETFLLSNALSMSIVNNLNNATDNFIPRATNLSQFNIGRRPDGTNFFGDMGEILIYNSNSYNSNDTRFNPQIEGYLAWKWGLQNILVSDHPYKNRSPS